MTGMRDTRNTKQPNETSMADMYAPGARSRPSKYDLIVVGYKGMKQFVMNLRITQSKGQ